MQDVKVVSLDELASEFGIRMQVRCRAHCLHSPPTSPDP